MDSNNIKLFSKYYSNRQKDSDWLFQKDALTAAYLVGAYASAIVESSWDGVFKTADEKKVQVSRVTENETFKKWLSNQQITYKNLLKISNKAAYFHRRFNLDSAINSDLSSLVTKHLTPKANEIVLDQEVSFAFLRGFNDFKTFKYTKREEM